MKVAIQLTTSDVKALISKHLNLGDVEFTFTINNTLIEGLDKVAGFLFTNEKIQAIKCLRQCVYDEKLSMGLADAKYAVEDFVNYRKACEADGQFILTWRQSWNPPL